MKVLLLTHHYPPEVGPPQRRWDLLVGRIRAAGHEVEVVTAVPHYPSGRASATAPRGRGRGRHGEPVVRVRYVPYDSGRGRRLLDQVVVALSSVAPALRARPDVVVATVPGMPTLLPALVVSLVRRVPLVIEMRDAWPDLMADAELGARWVRPLLAGVVSVVQRRAAVVVCVSAGFAERLRARGVSRVLHVPNGADPHLLGGAPGPSRAGRAGPLQVLYAGTVGESQGVELLVQALAHLPPGAVRLVVVGQGAGLPALRRAVAALPDPALVTLHDPVPPEQVGALVDAADTAVVCLRDWQAFDVTVPSKLYELMARGVHVTALLRGEAADLVRQAGAGDVVPPGDAAALAGLWGRLLTDRRRLDVGPRPVRWVAEHGDVRLLAGRYLDLLEGLVA